MIKKILRSDKGSYSVYLIFFCITTVLLVRWSLDSMSSLSIDLAHHYALVARLSDSWFIPYAGDSSLSEMNYYPRSSHLLAVVIGKIFGSPLMGIHVTTLISIIFVWMSVITIVWSMPKKAAIFVGVALSSILLINHYYPHFDLHGGEVDPHFFFAQLVAQAFVLMVIALTLHVDSVKLKRPLRDLLLILAIYITVGIHLLPALELLCFFIALLGIELYQKLSSEKNKWLTLGTTLTVIATASTVLFLHPAFARMRQISLHNGGLEIQYFSGPHAFLLYSSLIAAGSSLLIRTWFSMGQTDLAQRYRAIKYIGLYGLAVSGLCMAQVLALYLGYGSEYAVKKYIFALNTVCFIEVALFAFLIARKFKPTLMLEHQKQTQNHITYVLPSLLTAIAYFCTFPSHHLFRTSEVVPIERQLYSLKNRFHSTTSGKFDFVYDIKNLHPNLIYMFSTGVFKAPRALTLSPKVTDWNYVASIITSEKSTYDLDLACRRAAPENALVVLDGSCVSRQLGVAPTISFTNLNKSNPCTYEGLSVAEDFGTWTESKVVRIRCPLPANKEKPIQQIEIDSFGFIVQNSIQRVNANIKTYPPIEYRFDKAQPAQLIVLEFPKELTKETEIQIELALPDAISGKQLNISTDTRKLGVAIKSITFK